MSQRIQVTINGRSYLVEVEDLTASPLSVKVNGRSYVVQVDSAAANEGPSDPSRVTTNQQTIPATLPPTNQHAQSITAPLPGKIISVAVQPGDTIMVGQPLCVLEAMKMENTIRSPYNGRVREILIHPGQTVNHGDLMFQFEA